MAQPNAVSAAAAAWFIAIGRSRSPCICPQTYAATMAQEPRVACLVCLPVWVSWLAALPPSHQVDVVLVGPDSSALLDLDGHRSGDDVTRGQVLRGWGVSGGEKIHTHTYTCKWDNNKENTNITRFISILRF